METLGAVALGAKVVERHITLDKSMKGSDHACSLDMPELTRAVEAIRVMDRALGSDEKKFQPSETACFQKLGKSVVAKRFIPKGSVLAIGDLDIKVK